MRRRRPVGMKIAPTKPIILTFCDDLTDRRRWCDAIVVVSYPRVVPREDRKLICPCPECDSHDANPRLDPPLVAGRLTLVTAAVIRDTQAARRSIRFGVVTVFRLTALSSSAYELS